MACNWQRLSWKRHIDEMSKTISSAIGALKRVRPVPLSKSTKRWFYPTLTIQARRQVFFWSKEETDQTTTESRACSPGVCFPGELWKLGCLGQHFVRFEGSMMWRQAAESELRNMGITQTLKWNLFGVLEGAHKSCCYYKKTDLGSKTTLLS